MPASTEPPLPNIVLILADNLGWGEARTKARLAGRGNDRFGSVADMSRIGQLLPLALTFEFRQDHTE